MGYKQSKFSTLRSADKMTTTINGHPINKKIKLRFFSRAQINRIRRSEDTLPAVRDVLDPDYCEFTQIKDNLFLTGVGGLTKENVKENHVKCLINVTYEAPRYWVPGVQSFRIPVENTDPNISIYFDDLSDVVIELAKKESNPNIVVFCTTGNGRSATIILAILMKTFRTKLNVANDYVQNLRPMIRPSDQNWEQLIKYEYKVFGENTVTMTEVFDSFGNPIKVPDVYL